MDDERRTDGNLAIAGQKKVIVIEAAERPQNVKLRVAAYIRVSSDSEDQLNSFAAQNQYYSTLISSKKNWTMTDIYADRGITGTSAEKRDGFQRLLTDCRRGLIDRVLCKSISRFARNTTECLEAIRELKTLGIGISFEKEGIDTSKVSGEMLTAIFTALAQAESESISRNGTLGVQMRMKNGTFVPATQPYGYRRFGKEIVIYPSEAQQVRQIFEEYLSGYNAREIANHLNAEKCTELPRIWNYKAIIAILRNEKYTGNSIWQKSCQTETLPRQERRNHGEQAKYYAADTHPPIVTQEIFDKVQNLLAVRKEKYFGQRKIYISPTPGAIYCGYCGVHTRKKMINGKCYHICRNHDVDSKVCPITGIPESEIHAAFCRLYYKLRHHSDEILAPLLTDLQMIRSRRFLWSPDIIELNKQISNITSQNQLLAMLKQQGGVDPDIFISRSNELAEQLRAVKQEKSRLLNEKGDDTIARTQELIETLDAGPDFLDAFDGELFGELVEKIIVESNELLRFRLKSGLELTEKMERTVR